MSFSDIGVILALQVFSKELCEQMVAKYQAALDKALEAQSYSGWGRSVQHADVDKCQKNLDLWLGRLAVASAAPGRRAKARCRRSIPHG